MTAYKNPEWDLALDYYYTVKNGMSIEEAERVFEEFERNHYPGWDLRLFIREYIFLYIARFGLQKLPICNSADGSGRGIPAPESARSRKKSMSHERADSDQCTGSAGKGERERHARSCCSFRLNGCRLLPIWPCPL